MAAQLTPSEEAELALDAIACAAAEAFTDAYYYALEKDRSGIASFYCPQSGTAEGAVPFIAWNCQQYSNGAEFQTYYEGLTHTHYDVEGLDCNILNEKLLDPAEVKGGSGDASKDFDRRMSIQVVTMGSVRLEEPLKGPIREFSETFVLVPNPEKLLTPNPTFEKGWQKEWLIQTQNFRFTEWGANEIGGPVKDVETKAGGESKNSTQARNKGIAAQFAAAGLFAKGKGKP